MTNELLINVGAGETRIALVEAGVLTRLWRASTLAPSGGAVGDIHLGRVAKVVPAMEAAFVDIGLDRDGFLPLKEARLQEGEALLVRVVREAVGDKGARLAVQAPDSDLESRRAPAKGLGLLKAGPGIIRRALAQAPQAAVIVDDARTAQALRQAGRDVELAADELFARHALEDHLAVLSQPRVALPCGGWITIEPTTGMTAIDVNSGSFAASGGRDETSRVVNLDAARAIGRQLILRGIGGLVVVDFIRMDSAVEERDVVAALKAGLAGAGEVEISSLLRLGLVAIARERKDAVAGHDDCPLCHGSGRRDSAEVLALEMLRAVERAARAAPGREIVGRAPARVVGWLDVHRDAVRAGLDRRGVGRVRWLAEAREDCDVATV